MKIVAFSGRKQSGKNTAANLFLGLQLQQLGLVEKFDLTDKGELFLFDLMGQKADGIFDLNNQDADFKAFLKAHVLPYVRLYSFADLLKQQVCIDILGLTYEQCYGTDEDKNSLTNLKWENMPKASVCLDGAISGEKIPEGYHSTSGTYYHGPGKMTSREVLQHVGTNIFRYMYYNVWVDATIRQIKKDNPVFAVITDCRFPNEVEGVQKEDGIVIRYTRNPYANEDVHTSETALDKENFDWHKFDAIIHNENMTISEQCKDTTEVLMRLGVLY